ncbi:MCE family protein [Roseibium sp. CAU 1637]|uniref:MCE family protein n=1 Tax=Roseibium limicola TaxID=2816037 RepID=A0A939EJY2_9HYPH|nr:MlaD family protein [Roseibium limicola]MBO0343590.1 MCE family protein [Roseibium limicola]
METRANYITIGAFMMATLVAAFVVVYWLAVTAETRDNDFLKIVLPAPVTGLSVGGDVYFNGIKQGDVTSLDFDRDDPKVIVATVRLKPGTPVRADSTAFLNFQLLSGVAYVELNGGTLDSPILFDHGSDEIPVIRAGRSAYDDIVAGARDAIAKVDSTMETVDGFMKTNTVTVTKTLDNVQTFTEALASNSEGVETFMSSIGSASDAFSSLASRLKGVVDEAERILASVPSDKVGEIVGGLSEFSNSLGEASKGVDQVVVEAQSAAKEIQTFSKGLNAGLTDVRAIVAAVDPKQVDQAVRGVASLGEVLENRQDDLDSLVVSSKDTMANLKAMSATVAEHQEDLSKTLKQAAALMEKLNDIAADGKGVSASLDPQKISQIVASVEKVTTGLADQQHGIDAILQSAQRSATNVEQLSLTLSKRSPDVDKIISDAKDIASTLNGTSEKVDDIVGKVSAMVEGDGEGFVDEATQAAASIRKIAQAFEGRADSIAGGLNRFASKGPEDFGNAMSQINRTLISIQRAVENFDRAPNRIIFGGEDVPTFNGGRQRR